MPQHQIIPYTGNCARILVRSRCGAPKILCELETGAELYDFDIVRSRAHTRLTTSLLQLLSMCSSASQPHIFSCVQKTIYSHWFLGVSGGTTNCLYPV